MERTVEVYYDFGVDDESRRLAEALKAGFEPSMSDQVAADALLMSNLSPEQEAIVLLLAKARADGLVS